MKKNPITLPFVTAALALVALGALAGLFRADQVLSLIMVALAAATWWETHHRP